MLSGLFFYMPKRIAIQGFEASFHEAAANKFFGEEIDLQYCLTFQNVFDSMANREVDYAVMAIENSVAGSILPNYSRLRDSGLAIIGEVYIRIEMNLMALADQSVKDIKEVHSHPMALLQCHQFFRNHPHIKVVESDDTALSAKEIAVNVINGRGALASEKAAKIYDLDILAPGIETNKRNFTRFLVLDYAEGNSGKQTITKASWSFRTAHSSGSLAHALSVLGNLNINLTKIQSLPVLGEEWKYYFYADLEFQDYAAYQSAKEKVGQYIYDLKILGEYPIGNKYL